MIVRGMAFLILIRRLLLLFAACCGRLGAGRAGARSVARSICALPPCCLRLWRWRAA